MSVLIESLDFRYPGGGSEAVFSDLNLAISPGSTCALLAFSGVGKTTLLKLIGGLLSPTSGRITLATEWAGYVPQEPSLLPWLTVADNLALGGKLLGGLATLADWRSHLVQAFGLEAHLTHRPKHLSGGMKQRAAVISALTSGAQLLLLDEPFAGSDRARKIAMYAALREYVARHPQGVVIFTSHDVGDVFSLGATAVWLDSMTRQPTTISPAEGEWSPADRERLLDLMIREAV